MLRLKKIIKNVKNSTGKDYEWCGEYPIVEEGKKPFYVPYFQRRISWYVRILEKNNFSVVAIEDIKPNNDLLKKAQKEKLSPFYEHQSNIYWPYIKDIPSTYLLIGIKKHPNT